MRRSFRRGWMTSVAAVCVVAVVSGCGSAANSSPGADAVVAASATTTAAISAAERARQQHAHAAALRAQRAQLIAAERRSDATAAGDSLQTFSGAAFSIDYPSAWTISGSSSSGYHDTTIRSSDDLRLIRVDISDSAPSSDPEVLAAPVEKGLEGQPRYRLISWATTTFGAYDALRWEFVVAEDGVLLRKTDTFFVDDAGAGVAVLVQAPATGYQFWAPVFAAVRSSLVLNDTGSTLGGGQVQAAPPADAATFCDTHSCIANFDSGSGYIVQCADGMWSHSGGLQGACSSHGGETGNTSDGSSDGGGYVAPPTPAPSPAVIGPGNGYAVTCADGSISNSGGIQGACSHHGGVGP
jgi:hypothetical protein